MQSFKIKIIKSSFQNLHNFYTISWICQFFEFFKFFFFFFQLYPSRFLTIASLSQASLLLNARMPGNKRKRIKFPFLSSEIYEYVESMLHGGYSSSNSMYSNLNGGFFLNDDNDDDKDIVSLGWFSDMNALYPSRSG